ncbi:MAG: hypothetical protein JO247_24070 [Chloroflexi bacterium]|nr:hypothetical protein [Chloroflexota bacterium]
MPRLYIDTASLSLLIEKKTDPEADAVRQLLELGKNGQATILHSDVLDSWMWGARAESRKMALGPELESAQAEDIRSTLPITKFSSAALQQLTGEQKGELYKALAQAYARYFYQRSELGLIIATMTAIQHKADVMASPDAAKWQRFVFANVERIAQRQSGVPLKLVVPSRALQMLGAAASGQPVT